MCCHRGGNISTELQSLSGFHVITDYPVYFDIMTELQSLTGFFVITVYPVHFDIITEENVCDNVLRNDFAVGDTM